MTDRKTIDALNRVTEQLARIAAAVETGTAYTPRHAATLTPTYAIDDPSGGDTWDSMSDALAEISTWDESYRSDALDAGFVVQWKSPWLPVDNAATVMSQERAASPDDEVEELDALPNGWTIAELEAQPVGWSVLAANAKRWRKKVQHGDGYSLWESLDGSIRTTTTLLDLLNDPNHPQGGARS